MSTTVSADAFTLVGAGGRPVKPPQYRPPTFHVRRKARPADRKVHSQARKSFIARKEELKRASEAVKSAEPVVVEAGGGFGGAVRGRRRVMERLREPSTADSGLLALIEAEREKALAQKVARADSKRAHEESKVELEPAAAPVLRVPARRDPVALAVAQITRPFIDQQKLVADLKPIILTAMEAARSGGEQADDATIDSFKDIIAKKGHKELSFLTDHLVKPKSGRARSKAQIARRTAYWTGVRDRAKVILRHLITTFKIVFRDDSGIDLPSLKRLLLKTPTERDRFAIKPTTKLALADCLNLYSSRITAASKTQILLKLFFCSELTSSLFSPQPVATRAVKRSGTLKDFTYASARPDPEHSTLMALRFSQATVSATIRAGRGRSMSPQDFARMIKTEGWNKAHRILVVNRASVAGAASYEQTFDNRRVRAVVLACRNADTYTRITDTSVPALVVSGAAPVGLFPPHLIERALDVFKHYLSHNRGSKFSIDMTDEQAAQYIRTISWSQLIALRQNTFGSDSDKLVAQVREGYKRLPVIA